MAVLAWSDPICTGPKSPNLNAFAERWVRSVKEECLSKLILFGEDSLRRALTEYTEHYHFERNHQGKENRILLPNPQLALQKKHGPVLCKTRLNGLLNFYYREPTTMHQETQHADFFKFSNNGWKIKPVAGSSD
ncbi:MAG: integrase core domain-containing protein [Pseudomonadota bacterium]